MIPRKKILCFFDYFYPAFKSGGPARSSLGLVDSLSSWFELKVVTRDRDKDDRWSFKNQPVDQWAKFRDSSVYYMSPENRIGKIKKIICEAEADTYYFNSFYSPYFTLVPLFLSLLGLIPKAKMIIAPRGEFSPNAMKLKAFRKGIYRVLFRLLFLDKVKFHATAKHEIADILKIYRNAEIQYAPNLRSTGDLERPEFWQGQKQYGKLKVLFLSRISPMKNLAYALEVLAACKANIEFTIIGPVDDEEYWLKCQKIIKQTPSNITVSYRGAVSQSSVIGTIQQFDVLFVPSKGENFGHIFLESLMAGRPVLTSDNTPWVDLNAKNAGWTVSLSQKDQFAIILDELSGMTGDDYFKYASGAYQYAGKYLEEQKLHAKEYLSIFG